MNKNEFSYFRELRENLNRLMYRLIKNAHSPQSTALNLNQSQIQVILVLRKFGSLKMWELTRHTNLVKSTMTGIIDSLESLELVERLRSNDDRRIVIVKLTEPGNELASGLRKGVSDSFESKINCFSKEEREDFFKTINKLSQYFIKMEKNDE
jgi:DNA-binding MarR family transcriptional regulator